MCCTSSSAIAPCRRIRRTGPRTRLLCSLVKKAHEIALLWWVPVSLEGRAATKKSKSGGKQMRNVSHTLHGQND